MLEFFKKNHLLNSLLFLPYAIVIRIVVIIFQGQGFLARFSGPGAVKFISATHQWGIGEFMLSTFLVFIQAALINRIFITSKHDR